jgi:hypothetical protein
LTASNLTPGTYPITASSAISASWAPAWTLNTGSTYPITSSWSQFALTASYVANIPSGSAVSSSYALTASYAMNGGGAPSVSSSYANTSSIIVFNGNRTIKRSGYTSVNAGGEDLKQFIENFFFPFIPATVAISPGGTTLYQVGTSNAFSVVSSVTANDETIYGTASVKRDGTEVYTASVPPLAFSYTDSAITTNHSYISYVSVDNNGSPTVISSNTKTATFVYPYLWGMSTGSGLSGTALYNAFTKQVVASGNKTVSLVGNSTYIYFAYPATYPALTSILDPNSFEVIGNFQYSSSVSVTSTGLDSDWTTNYKVYRTLLVSDPNGNYQFKQ